MQQKNQTGKNNSISHIRHSFEIPRKKIPHDPQSLHLMFPLPVFQSWIVHFQGFDYTLLCFQGTNFLYFSIQKKSESVDYNHSPCQVFSFLSILEMKINCVSYITFPLGTAFCQNSVHEIGVATSTQQNLEVTFEVKLSDGLITCFVHLTFHYWLCLSGRDTMELVLIWSHILRRVLQL